MSHSMWAKAQPGISATAKAVLKTLADYASPDGDTAVTIAVIRVETSLGTDRTVQRGLRELRKAGLVLETSDFKVIGGRRVPLYRLALDRGPQNTRERLALERAAAEAAAVASTGDTHVTPGDGSGGLGCHPCHPTGDTHVTPRVTPMSPKEEVREIENKGVCVQAHAPEAAGWVVSEPFDRLVRRWSQVAPERVSPELAQGGWAKAAAKVDPERLADAGLRYLAQAGEVKRGRCKALHAWLSERRFEVWIAKAADADADGDGGLLALARARFPDAALRAAIVGWWNGCGLDGEAWATSYLDPARLDGRVVTPATAYARGKLLEHPALWTRLELTIAPARAAGREDGRVSAAASGAGGR